MNEPLRQDRTRRADAVSSPDWAFRVSERARESVADKFLNGITKNAIRRTVAELIELSEAATEQQIESDPPSSSIDCRAGCGYCCHMRVHVTPQEVIFLVEYIRAHFSTEELGALMGRLEATDRITHGMGDEERGRVRVPCPLLVESSCSAYRARPLECRGYVSMDVNACRCALEDYAAWNVPLYAPQYAIFKHMQVGLIVGSVNAGYPFDILELTSALRIALEVPDVAERWLAGEDIFGAAALPPDDPERLALHPWTPTFEVPRMRASG